MTCGLANGLLAALARRDAGGPPGIDLSLASRATQELMFLSTAAVAPVAMVTEFKVVNNKREKHLNNKLS